MKTYLCACVSDLIVCEQLITYRFINAGQLQCNLSNMLKFNDMGTPCEGATLDHLDNKI